MQLHTYLNDGGNCQQAFRFAMLRDRFGTSWMILHPRPQAGAS
jgi:predicted 3-demethylubiquinone-9 3-methyltransferase (glyoxalase superfamily)